MKTEQAPRVDDAHEKGRVPSVGCGDLFGPPPAHPKRGLIFLHKRIIYPDTKTPAKMVVTCVRNGGIYYRFLSGGGHEYVTLERWPHVAASVPNSIIISK